MESINLLLSEDDVQCLNNVPVTLTKELTVSFDSLLKKKNNGNLDGNKVIKKMMPKGNYKVFISYSHKDVDLARKLAQYISSKTNHKCFIDADVWANVDDLQNAWDNKCLYSEKVNGIDRPFYNHSEVLFHSTNTRMMLATSLLSIIKKCDYFIFLNTSNSSTILDGAEIDTSSPWLFFELTAADVFDSSCLCHFDDFIDESVEYSIKPKNMKKITTLSSLLCLMKE